MSGQQVGVTLQSDSLNLCLVVKLLETSLKFWKPPPFKRDDAILHLHNSVEYQVNNTPKARVLLTKDGNVSCPKDRNPSVFVKGVLTWAVSTHVNFLALTNVQQM